MQSVDTTDTIGLVTDNQDGTFNYDPNRQFESLGIGETSTDTFTYIVVDENGNTDSAVVTITITGQFDPPPFTPAEIGFATYDIELTETDRPTAVFAADIDGDGDLDMLSASHDDNKIAWYENADGQGIFGEQRVITTIAYEAQSVFSADVDADGDMDVLWAASRFGIGDRIVWQENLDGKGMFGEEQVISTDVQNALSVVAADLDGDGDVDVLSAHFGHGGYGTPAWYENIDGRGTFSEQRPINASSVTARSVFAADIDSDGDLDVLSTGTSRKGYIGWHENTNGLGEFEEHVVTTAVEDTSAVVAADVDGDGDNDLIASSHSSSIDGDGEVIWFENLDGLGLFSEARLITSNAPGVESIFVADLDGDRDADVLTASGDDNKITWYKNTDGKGMYSEFVISANVARASSVFAGDMDGDGDLDVIGAASAGDEIFYFENIDGRGGFAGQQRIIATEESIARDVQFNDVDDDGDLDVISATEDQILVYDNVDAKGNFSDGPVISVDVMGLNSIDIGDLDSDGDDDLVSASFHLECGEFVCTAESELVWHENLNGDRYRDHRFSSPNVRQFKSVRMSDLNSDGALDVVAVFADDSIVWFENTDGRGRFGEQKSIVVGQRGLESVSTGDIDGDGDYDLLSISTMSNCQGGCRAIETVVWYENLNGRGLFGELRTIHISEKEGPRAGLGVQPVSPQDLDGDGDLDVLMASRRDDTLSWFENVDGKGKFGNQKIITRRANTVDSVFANDLDNDGDLDLFAALADKIVWYANLDGSAEKWQRQSIATGIVARPWRVRAGDVDGDGDLDVVSTSVLDKTVAWYQNDDGHFGIDDAVITTGADLAFSAFPADVDSDGDLDVVSASLGDGKVSWYENLDGDGKFGHQHVISRIASPMAVTAGDVDGDGDVDVVSAPSDGDRRIVWYRNGESDPQHVGFLTGTSSVSVRDFDGDGDMDILAATEERYFCEPNSCWREGKVVWFENTNTFFEERLIAISGTPITDSSPEGFSAHPANIDGDGDIDVVVAASGDDYIAWHENVDGHGTFGEQRLIPADVDRPESIFAGDLDGDGDLDVISASSYDGKIAWYENTDGNGRFSNEQIIAISVRRGRTVSAGDLDADGDLDVIFTPDNESTITWYENVDGLGDFSERHIIANLARGASSLVPSDIDSDGDVDILATSWRESRIMWYENRPFGDSNDDGRFDSGDFIFIFGIGEYEDAIEGNSTFEDGDWNGDGDFDSSDLVAAFQIGTYVATALAIGTFHHDLGFSIAAVDWYLAQEDERKSGAYVA